MENYFQKHIRGHIYYKLCLLILLLESCSQISHHMDKQSGRSKWYIDVDSIAVQVTGIPPQETHLSVTPQLESVQLNSVIYVQPVYTGNSITQSERKDQGVDLALAQDPLTQERQGAYECCKLCGLWK